jgi:hypothetical protein
MAQFRYNYIRVASVQEARQESIVAITTIPVPYRQGFARIKKLTSADVDSFVAALEKTQSAGRIKEVTAAVVSQVPNLSRADVESILRTLYSLCAFVSDEETPLAEHLSELTSAMQASGRTELALSENERIEFEERLNKLLSVKTLVISSKVERLRLDYPATLHDATILSDIRPIFDTADERPVGCAIAHTLEIEYHESGEHKEFYVVLDNEDLQKMKRVIQRAEAKAASLKALLKTSGLPDLS